MIHKDQSTKPRGKTQENVCIPSKLKHSMGRLQPPRKIHHSVQQLFLTSGFLPVRTSPLLHLLLYIQGFQQPSPSSVSATLQNTSHFFPLLSSALILFFFLTSPLQDKYPHITMIIPIKKGCKSPFIFKGCPFRIRGVLVWKERRSMA